MCIATCIACGNVCKSVCLSGKYRQTLTEYFLRQAVVLETGLQGQPLPSQTESISDSESKRGRVVEWRWKELGRDRRTTEIDKEESKGIRKA